MAEKKKKDPKFGGKRSLKDTSGNKSIGFEDTFLGDLLGFDGKMGTKGKPGLLASLKGARRKKPGTATTTTKKKGPAKVRPVLRPKPAAKGPVRRGDGTQAGVEARPEGETNQGPSRRGSVRTRIEKGQGSGRRGSVKTPRSPSKRDSDFRQKLKGVTMQKWDSMSQAERAAAGLPKSPQDVFRLTGALTRGAAKFNNAFRQPSGMNKGGMAKKKPAAKMMAGGMAKKKPTAKMMGGGMAKSGYMYGGSVTKKKPVTKMNKGGMTKKK